MAIIIPSKNIYQKQNQKIRDNVIESIEVGAGLVNTVAKFGDNAYSASFDTSKLFDFDFSIGEDLLPRFNDGVGSFSFSSYSYYSVYYYLAGNGIGVRPYYKTISLSIPKNSVEKYIKKIYEHKDKDGNNNIKSSITYDYRIGSVEGQIEKESGIDDKDNNDPYSRYKLSKLISYHLGARERRRDEISFTNSWSFKVIKDNQSSPTITSTLDIENEENLSTANIEYNQDNDTYNVTLTVLCGFVQWQVVFSEYDSVAKDDQNSKYYTSGDFVGFQAEFPQTVGNNMGYGTPSRGVLEVFEPLQLNIDFYGDTIVLDIKNEVIKIGDETRKKVFSVDGNELIQTTNYLQDTGESAIEKMFGDTKTAYEKGKETATIRCSISDYYYEDGIKEIAIDNSTDKMMFEEYDRVIPMVYGNNGDSPMSLNTDGTPKEFFVLGVRPYYDGAVWQELHLQEAEKGIDFWSFSVSYIDTQGSDYIKLRLIGKGDIYTNGELFSSIDTQEEEFIIKETREVQNVVLIGDFSYIKVEGTSVTVLHWNKYARTIYNSMFAYDILNDFTIPSHIVEIGMRAFDNATIEEITIPKSIRKIGNAAFADCSVKTVRFMHGENNKIELPVAGRTGAFYCKSAKEMTIYTDNLTIKNYDWVADNITPTFYHLDGTAWS